MILENLGCLLPFGRSITISEFLIKLSMLQHLITMWDKSNIPNEQELEKMKSKLLKELNKFND